MVGKLAVTITTAVLAAFSASAATISRRIVGGQEVQDGEIPFLVSIVGTRGICGGALLDSTTVLTAAHCLEGTVSVRAGSRQQKTGGTQVNIASRKAHPEYRSNRRDKTKPFENNDIGIIKLSTPIETNDKIAYATLAAAGSDPAVNSMAVLAGWGLQKPSYNAAGSASETLAKITIPIHTRDVCAGLNPGVGDRDTVVCAGGNGKTACKYDSGSPLIDQQTGQVIGVTSWGIRDEQGNLCNQAPDVYTRVGRYISFINENLESSDSGVEAAPTTVAATATATAPTTNETTTVGEPLAESPTSTAEQGPRAKEDELCSTAVRPNKYGIPEDQCRRMVAQCIFEQSQQNTVPNFDGVENCMDSRF